MRLILKNIGILKYADVEISNLSVIAGENDTGKSTVGKSLVCLIKTEVISRAKYLKKLKALKNKGVNKTYLEKYFSKNRKYGFNRLRELLFKDLLRTNLDLYEPEDKEFKIKLSFDDGNSLEVFFNKNKNEWDFSENSFGLEYKFPYKDISYIQSPLIWDLQSFFNSILQMKLQIEIEEDIKFEFEYPYLLWDLYGKFVRKKIKNISTFHKSILRIIKNEIIDGEFVKREGNLFVFRRNNVDIPLVNIAHGIKSFGILQVLLENGYISRYGMLVIDEPEVHLHPTWQIKYAHILIKLAKNGIKILVHSHSPYMIEALKRYAEIEGIEEKTKFYLAHNRVIEYQKSLENIFEKLGQPIHELKKLKVSKYLE